MSRNPCFNYTEFCLEGFRKTFPILREGDPTAIAHRLYEDASAFSGRDGRSNAGGSADDLLCLVAAAADVEFEVYAAREIKDSLRVKLRQAWQANDHATIFRKARDFERSASMAVIDLRDVLWADHHRISEDDGEEIEIPEAFAEWIEVICEPSQARSVIGNHSRKKLRRKLASRAVNSLFEGEE